MRSLVALFLLVFCFSGFGQVINFPDPNFKNALVNTKCVDTDTDGKGDVDADVNNDGEIDIAEALKVNRLHISNKSIVRLDGINYFKNLKSLNCNHNLIEEINLDSLNVIYDIHLEFNNIKVLKLMNMDLLENLYCYNNKLDTLLLAQFPNLIYFNCSHNNLGDLKLFNFKKLRLLSCSHNKLKKS
jgi:Leucine-rich repeat (LRR) protein